MVKTPKKASKSKTPNKSVKVIALLQCNTGATVAELAKVTGWQRQSVHGFIPGTLKKKQGFEIKSTKEGDADRRYQIEGDAR